MTEKFYCGAAKRIVTPSLDLLQNLRGNVGMEFNAVHDDLYLRVIAMASGEEKALIICFESGYPCDQSQMKKICEHTGVPEENIMVLHTHAHAVPMMAGATKEGTGNPRKHVNKFDENPIEVQEATLEYIDFLNEQLFSAADEALASLRPARIGYGYGESFINGCRNIRYVAPDGSNEKYGLGMDWSKQVDHTLFVMKFEDLNGKPIAFYINYPVHNCVMVFNHCGKDGKAAISSDISGKACVNLETEFEGSVALWTSGAAGDLNPIFGNEIFYPDPATGNPTRYETKGGEIADAMLQVLSSRHYADILSVIRDIHCEETAAEIRSAVEWSFTPGVDGEDQIVPDLYKVRLQLIKVGDIAFLGSSGELFSSYGKLIKEISPMKNTIVMNHNASDFAGNDYIYDEEAFRHSPGLVQSPPDAIAPSTLRGGIVAIEHSQMVPGYFTQSLISVVEKLFKQVCD